MARLTFAKSLRVIGQILEVARVSRFQLEGNGQNFIVRSDAMSRTAEWMLRYAVRDNDFSTLEGRRSAVDKSAELNPVEFSNSDILRLDVRGAKRRRELSNSELSKLSQLLRNLGDHLDKSSARTFHIFWMSDSVVVDYRRADGLPERQRFTHEKLLLFGKAGFRAAAN